ncbi:MAG: molybdopterin-dependent oxidoreductase, partial [Coriobacteriales bacterium]|nr:molybdopterin-dependent oxidoreductase [Coriobacteriales bacterium]
MKVMRITRRSFLKLCAVTAAASCASMSFAGNGFAAADGSSSEAGSVKVVRTCCRGCGKMECGVLVTVRDGRAIKVEGDETAFHSMGNCCTKSQASIQACYHPDRLHHPLKRTQPKGDDPGWVRITWDEAFQTCGTKYRELEDRYGGETLFTMGGTSRVYAMSYSSVKGTLNSPNAMCAFQVCKGPRHFATEMVSQFAHSWMATIDHPLVYVSWGGASEISNYDDSCRTTVDVATKAEVHISVDPRQSPMGKEADYWQSIRPGTDSALALAWANVIIENELYDDLYVKRWTDGPFLFCADVTPDGFNTGIRGRFDLKTRLLKECDLIEGGSKTRFMVWDNLNDRLTWWDANPAIARWEGEDWVPQTKGAEAKQKNLSKGYSQGWVADPSPFNPEIDPALYCEFEVTLKDGRKSKAIPVWDLYAQRCAEYTPAKTAEITGLDAQQITEAAKTYATRLDPTTGYGNGGIQYMLAVEHYGNAIQNCRAIDAICGMTGNFDTPAGQRGPTRIGIAGLPLSTPYGGPRTTPDQNKKQLSLDRFPLLGWWTSWADATSIWDAVHTDIPYKVSCAYNHAGDHMNQSNAAYGWEGLKKLDFYLGLELWHAPSSGMADILLPACHWMEMECVRLAQGSSGAFGANIKCVEKPADCHWDPIIVRDLYKSLGCNWGPDPLDPWPDDITGVQNMDIAETGMVWSEYREKFLKDGWWDCKVYCPQDWGTYRRYEIGRLRTPRPYGTTIAPTYVPTPGFSTPTMKQEIWSTVMESFHPGQGWELPTFTEPPESPVSAPQTFKDYPFTVITGRRIPVYFHNEHRQLPWCRELWPAPRMEINPEDAEELGLKQGDWAWIESPRGKIRQTVDLFWGIPRHVINCEHQWWFPEFPGASHGYELVHPNVLTDPHFQDPHCGTSNV